MDRGATKPLNPAEARLDGPAPAGTESPKVQYLAASGASAPAYASAGSAGADLRAFIDSPVVLKPGERTLIPTGLRLAIPPGWEGQVRPRSGLAVDHGVTVLNAPGTIDSDYRGEVKVILANMGDEPFRIESGDRIAQLIIAPVSQAAFERTIGLEETKRGTGGFGSTGISD